MSTKCTVTVERKEIDERRFDLIGRALTLGFLNFDITGITVATRLTDTQLEMVITKDKPNTSMYMLKRDVTLVKETIRKGAKLQLMVTNVRSPVWVVSPSEVEGVPAKTVPIYEQDAIPEDALEQIS